MASADTIDRALVAVPSGQISCEQASRYWTNTADYNNKVAQARAVATFDRRGPQILDALARIDEAANRCGLKGGGAPAQGGQGGRSQGGGAPAPSHGAPAVETPGVNPAPQGTAVTSSGQPATQVYVPVVDQWITVPDLYAMVRDFLGRFGVHI